MDEEKASTPIRQIFSADPGRVANERIDELVLAFRTVVESGWFILGKQVEILEERFGIWQEGGNAIGVANGTDAIELCLRACGIGSNDLVILPTHTAVATAAAVCRTGAEPLLLDVDARKFQLSLEQIEFVLSRPEFSSRVKAVLPVHLYGNPCDMTMLTSLSEKHGIALIEDCSQAHGARWDGVRVGNFGHAAAFSCYPTKNLGALGDAGICVTGSTAIADHIKRLRQYGWRERYISEEVGMNSRLDEVQAALLLVQLRHLNADIERRLEIARFYHDHLSDLPILLPQTDLKALHAYHQYAILVREGQRDQLRVHLQQAGIGTAVLYPLPIHLQPAYRAIASKYPLARSCSEQVCLNHLCLPLHPTLSNDDLVRVIERLKCFPWA